MRFIGETEILVMSHISPKSGKRFKVKYILVMIDDSFGSLRNVNRRMLAFCVNVKLFLNYS